MSLDPAAQAHALGLCLAAGALLGPQGWPDREQQLLPLPRLLGGLADLAFWAAAALLLFACALLLGDGRVRLYMAAGVMAGATVYFLTLSSAVRRFLGLIGGLLVRAGCVLVLPLKKLPLFEKTSEKTLPFSEGRE